jgi:hypothetical protein
VHGGHVDSSNEVASHALGGGNEGVARYAPTQADFPQ